MPNSRGISGGRGGKAGPEKGQREQDGPLEEGGEEAMGGGSEDPAQAASS